MNEQDTPWGILILLFLHICIQRQETGKDRSDMREEKAKNIEAGQGDCCRHKATPRQEKELRQLKNRLNRIVGQLNGISKMLDDNRYCGEILTQTAAAESALQAFGYAVLKDHMESCVVEEIKKGNTEVVDETVELIKKLK